MKSPWDKDPGTVIIKKDEVTEHIKKPGSGAEKPESTKRHTTQVKSLDEFSISTPAGDLKTFRGTDLGQLLLNTSKLKPEQLADAIATQKEQGGSDEMLGEILLRKKFINEHELLNALSLQLNIPMAQNLGKTEVDVALATQVPINFAKKHGLVPIRKENNAAIVAISNGVDLSPIDDIRILLGMDVKLILARKTEIMETINRVYDRASQAKEDLHGDLMDDLEAQGLDNVNLNETQDLLDSDADEAPIIRLVNTLLFQAVKERASDIHIEPYEKELSVRFRIDGVLYEIMKPPKRAQNSISSRIKIMAELDIAERRIPQDGRIKIKIGGRDVDIRVSTLPTSFGERIVMRLLDTSKVLLNLADIGFSEKQLHTMSQIINLSHGIFLVTGPTGSGKTTTLYACLSKINSKELNIITVEDPVEIQLGGIGQIQVNPKVDLTFAQGLRSILRQDPDVIMVGEIRDLETAEIAIQASLTGHLVFSTLHTNDSASAVTRLVDMGVEPFLVSSSLVAVMAQRLIRVVCKQCREAYKPSAAELEEIGITLEQAAKATIYRPKGCGACTNTGYLGRSGIYEIMPIDEVLRALILKAADGATIKKAAAARGMLSLRDDGAMKVLKGLTTIEEILRVTQEDMVMNSMPVFQYKAVTSGGRNTKGIIDAPSATEARGRLRKEGTFVTEIVESLSAEGPSLPGNIRFSRGRVSLEDVTMMTRQLATLIAAGIPLVESLNALVDQVENLKLKRALSDVRERVNEGSSLADAIKAHPQIFNNLFINMIRAGEASGALEIVLNRLADYSENQNRLKGKLTSALAYPAIMIIIGILAMVIIFTFVIPKLIRLYQDLGQALPLPTQVLIMISQMFTSYWYIVGAVVVIAYYSFRKYISTTNGRYRFDHFLLNMPIFGPMFRMVAIARFANTLSTLLASGVPILMAMDIVKNVLNNVVLTRVIEAVRTNVSEGDSIAEPLKRSGEFPPLVTHMIAIGEKTGEVESMLKKVAETYNNQVDTRMATMTALIEPIMIVVMATVIGFIVFSVMLPIFNMNQAIK